MTGDRLKRRVSRQCQNVLIFSILYSKQYFLNIAGSPWFPVSQTARQGARVTGLRLTLKLAERVTGCGLSGSRRAEWWRRMEQRRPAYRAKR